MDNPVKGVIKLNDKTRTHPETLRELGYEVEVDQDEKKIYVQASGFVTDQVDISTPEKLNEVVGGVLRNKQLFTYSTRFVTGQDEETGEPKVLFGFPALSSLGAAAALMAKPSKKKRKKKEGPSIDALKALARS